MSHIVSDRVRALAQPIIQNAGFELSDVEYKKEGQDWFLRVFLDKKEKPVDLDACATVSEQLSKVLDDMDFISNAYFLEVSSRGIDPPLKTKEEFLKAVGNQVHISTYGPIHGKKSFKGVLEGLEENGIVLRENDAEFKIPLKKIANARLDMGNE